MATIQARRTNEGTHYKVQVRLRGHPPVTASFERRTDAKKWAQNTESAIRDGRYFPTHEAKRRTLADLVDRYLEQTEAKRDAAYFERKKHYLTWWKDQIGDYTLAQVSPALVAEYRDKLLRQNIGDKATPWHRSPATANRFLSALSKAFGDAVREWHWLPDNPLRRVAKEQESAGRVRYLSEEERNRLLEACQQSELPELHLIVLLALTTGMRRGEILGLRWQDLDLERRLIVLHKTKNGERRSVPIVPAVEALMREHGKVPHLDNAPVFPHRKRKQKKADATAAAAASNVVELRPQPVDADPANDAGGPLWFDQFWFAALEAAGIEDFRFHDLRHYLPFLTM